MRDCLPIHVDEVPTYEVRGDCMRIEWRGLEIFVPIPICLAAMGRCQSAIRQWERTQATIIPFRTDVAAE